MNDEITPKRIRQPGAGRKSGSGLYKEETSVIRVPNSQKPLIASFLEAYARKQRLAALKEQLDAVDTLLQAAETVEALSLPLYQSKVPAGLPSTADDHLDDRMDPNQYLIDQAEHTFIVTIQGESMLEAGLLPGDKAIINRKKTASNGDIILAMIDGEFTIKTLARQSDGMPKLLPANSSGKYAPILITSRMQFEIWGVVTGSFRRF